LSAGAFAILTAAAIQDRVTGVKGQGAGGQPHDGGRRTADGEGLGSEFEGDRADQHAGAEGHDQAGDAAGRAQQQSQRSADQQRRAADATPERRFQQRLGLPPLRPQGAPRRVSG